MDTFAAVLVPIAGSPGVLVVKVTAFDRQQGDRGGTIRDAHLRV
jgi:hypothetical protein